MSFFTDQILSSLNYTVRASRNAVCVINTVFTNGSNFNATSFEDARVTAYTSATNANATFTFNANLSNASNIGLNDGSIRINISGDTLNVPARAYTFDLDVKDTLNSGWQAFGQGIIDVQPSRP